MTPTTAAVLTLAIVVGVGLSAVVAALRDIRRAIDGRRSHVPPRPLPARPQQ